MRRRAVRNLHSGHGDGYGSSAGPPSRAHPGTGSRGPGRKPVPVYRLYAHLPGRIGSGGYENVRARPSEYELVAPGQLAAVLELLASEPGSWMPIAGGTELMVQYSAGRLGARKLVSLWGLPELRRIDSTAQELIIGAGCTYTDLRNHPQVAQEFPLLARAASWTGSIANQNRGTLGGNIVNASPAADSLPALMVYEAELLLISARGTRRVPYTEFHTGYKQTKLAADEIIRADRVATAICRLHSYSRKVGTRNAQAIAKLCLAGLGKVSDNKIEDVRLAIGSMAVTPLRLRRTERFCWAGRGVPHWCAKPGRHWKPKLLLSMTFAPALPTGCMLRAICCRNFSKDCSLEPVLARWHTLPPEEAAKRYSPAAAPVPGPRSWRRCDPSQTSKPLRRRRRVLAASTRGRLAEASAATRASEKNMPRTRQPQPRPRGHVRSRAR